MILQLANNAIQTAKFDGHEITMFLMTRETERLFMGEMVDPREEDIALHGACPGGTILGKPYELFDTLLQCVHRSAELAAAGYVGWILNPDPLSKIVPQPSDNDGGVP